MAFRCRECGNMVGGVNPEKCPVCGFTVFEPVEGSTFEGGEERTEDFDVDAALGRLSESKDGEDPEDVSGGIEKGGSEGQ